MKVINRYIAIEMIKSTALAVTFLLSLVLIITFADELDDMGKGQYDFFAILKYLALIAPRNFYELLPAATLLGALVTLGSMADKHELTAMRAAGVSRIQIIFSTLRVGLMVIVVSVFVSEFIAPNTEQAAQMLKYTAKNQKIAMQTRYGFWTRDDNTFINIRKIDNSNELKDVNIYEMTNNQKLIASTHANKASYNNGKWLLKGVKTTQFEENTVTVVPSKVMEVDTLIEPELLDVIVVRPERLSMSGLVSYIQFLVENGQDASQFVSALTSKVVRPFVILVMLLIAIPFVLGTQRVSNTSSRILIGALIGIGFNLVDRLFGNIGLVYGLPPVIAATLPFFIALTASLYTIRRMP